MMAQNGKSVGITLTVGEGALVMEALAELPFKTVFALIGDLNRQANEAGGAGAHEAAHEFTFERAELALIVKALGDLPYSRVHALLANLSLQIAEQE